MFVLGLLFFFSSSFASYFVTFFLQFEGIPWCYYEIGTPADCQALGTDRVDCGMWGLYQVF